MKPKEVDYLATLALAASEKRGISLSDTLKEAFNGLESIDKFEAKNRLVKLIGEEEHGN